jgi:hypothetical protein
MLLKWVYSRLTLGFILLTGTDSLLTQADSLLTGPISFFNGH